MPATGSPGRFAVALLIYGAQWRDRCLGSTDTLAAPPRARQCATDRTGAPCRTLCQSANRPSLWLATVDT